MKLKIFSSFLLLTLMTCQTANAMFKDEDGETIERAAWKKYLCCWWKPSKKEKADHYYRKGERIWEEDQKNDLSRSSQAMRRAVELGHPNATDTLRKVENYYDGYHPHWREKVQFDYSPYFSDNNSFATSVSQNDINEGLPNEPFPEQTINKRNKKSAIRELKMFKAKELSLMEFAETLKSDTALKVLDLSCKEDSIYDDFYEEDAKIIAEALENNATLEEVNLHGRSMGDHSLKHIIKAVESTNIKKLNLRFNNLQSEGVKYIINSLNVNHTLTELDLRDNRNLAFDIISGHTFNYKKELNKLQILRPNLKIYYNSSPFDTF